MHACLVYYGNNSKTEDFPLVLVIGREPNCSQSVVPGDGQYNFRDSPKCGFWNASYQLAARVSLAGTAGELKNICQSRDASPIIYADALPFGLLNAVRTKTQQRRAITDDMISRHAHDIASQNEWMQRVRLVLFAGLHQEFSRSIHALTQHLSEFAPIHAVPFFTNQNAKKLHASVQNEPWVASRLSGIVNDFLRVR